MSKMEHGPTYDLVIRLRTIRDELGLSVKAISQMLEESPEIKFPPSESTLNRVFNGDLEAISGFNYETTLRPLCDLLFPKGDLLDNDLTQARIEGLMAEIALQKETIDSMADQIRDLMDAHKKERSEAARTQSERCRKCAEDIAFLKDQISLKDARMDKKDEWIDRLLGHIEEMLHNPK